MPFRFAETAKVLLDVYVLLFLRPLLCDISWCGSEPQMTLRSRRGYGRFCRIFAKRVKPRVAMGCQNSITSN